MILANSGGPDSACIAKKLFDDGFDVHSLHVNIGLGVGQEDSARITAEKWCSDHHEIDINFGKPPTYVRNLGHKYADGTPKFMWGIPALGAVIVSLVATYGGIQDILEAYFGFSDEMEDIEGWSKGQLAFIDGWPINKRVVERVFPLWGMSKEDGLRWAGIEDPRALDYTVSCNIYPSCGECHKCVQRMEAGIGFEGGH